MAQKLNPFSARQFIDDDGNPRVGAKLFIYLPGTATKVTTTQDESGLVNHTNPIILNASGEPADVAGAAKPIWQEDRVSVDMVLAPSTDSDPPLSAISTWEDISGINDSGPLTADSQWLDGPTPTYISATSFTLIGDQVTDFHIGRRIRSVNSGGTVYSTITNAVYTTLTTITVENDSGALDSGLSSVSYALLTATNNSVPGGTHQAATAFNKVITFNKQIKYTKGADIASASALTLGADGNYFDVTGTTAITSISAVNAGTVIRLHFDAALTLTYHATNLILPDAANITTAAGDEAEFIEYEAGKWTLLNYRYLTTPKIQTADLEQTGGSEAVTQATIRDAAVGQAQLITTTATGSQSIGTATGYTYALTGGTYSWWTASSTSTTGSVTFGSGDVAAGSVGFYNTSTGSANTVYVDERYVQACPPYKLDDIVPIFVFALLDSSGQIAGLRISEDPPYAHHGPTDITASKYDKQGRGWRREKRYMIDYYNGVKPHILEELRSPSTYDSALLRLADDAQEEDFEITLDFKNRDMGVMPHWWAGQDITGKTVVMLDPTGPEAFQLMEILHVADAREVMNLFNSGEVVFQTDPVNRMTPPGVVAVSANWKNTV